MEAEEVTPSRQKAIGGLEDTVYCTTILLYVAELGIDPDKKRIYDIYLRRALSHTVKIIWNSEYSRHSGLKSSIAQL